jgi:hypothetical protein
MNKVELLVPHAYDAPGRTAIERIGRGYWHFVVRRSFGLIGESEDSNGRIGLFLRGTHLDLLSFDRPRYEATTGGGSVEWPIAAGVLVSRRGPGQGFLRLTLSRTGGNRNSTTICAAMEVRGFYPRLRGEGRLAILGAPLYTLTQRVIHRAMTRAYLRSLADAKPDRVLDSG